VKNGALSSDRSGPSTRRAFLRRAGKTLAIGLGVSLLPVSNAYASGAHCCPDSSCGVGVCNHGTVNGYRCFDQCSNTSCCAGCLGTGQCVDKPCGACG
jgi:hypothetical protein